MNAVISRALDRLNRALEAAAASLDAEEAQQLREAARRSVMALSQLDAKLTGPPWGSQVDLGHIAAGLRFPALREPEARSLLNELSGIIADIEREVLVPAESELNSAELAELKQAVGQVWGWLVCDLQDPIWKQYPETVPSEQ